MENQIIYRNPKLQAAIWVFLLAALFLVSRVNYLLFHSLAEIFSITISWCIFIFAFNSRRFVSTDYFLFLGVAYLYVGFFDLIHTLAYKGMGVFPGQGADLPTQLWIATRYLESLALLAAVWFINRKLNLYYCFLFFFSIGLLLLFSLFVWRNFPVCFIEGQGLTPFKRWSEYLIACILMVALLVLWKHRRAFDPEVLRLLIASVVLTVFSELAFTFYVSVYGLSNLMGHYLKIASFYCLYRAIIATGLESPYSVLLQTLKQKETGLQQAHDELEQRVEERTIELREANSRLRREITEREQAEMERKKLEAQLFEAQKMESIGRLAGGVAHDFNNLLTAIQGFADLIHVSLNDKDPLREDVDEIRRAADSAAVLTEQLLAFSRRQIISPRVLNLNSVIASSEKMLRRIIGEDIELEFIGDPDLGQVKIDPNQVEQILINLAVNARDAMEQGGRLTLETHNIIVENEKAFVRQEEIQGNYVMLAVSDSGPGIPEEIKVNIFEPFFTTKPSEKGTGLGLSTIYGIIRQNNGYINVYSESGHGTTFKVYLPRTDEAAGEMEKEVEISGLAGSETIMVAEDLKVVRKMIEKTLSCKGYKVITAADGGEALFRFEQAEKKIDLLLTDVVMPHMSGRQLYSKLVQLEPGLKVLYMSGYTENTIAHHNILDNDIHFIQKPFRPDDLLHKIRLILDSEDDGEDKTSGKSGPTHDADREDSGAVPGFDTSGAQKTSGRNTVLVIDDNQQFHTLLGRYAEETELNTLSALYGRDGVKLLRKHGDRIALIIADLNLTDCNGVDLVERLTDIRADIPIILASGCMPDDIKARKFSKGKVVCEEKPMRDIDTWFFSLLNKYCPVNH